MRVGYSVPATSANLGPGFDSFGIALELFNKFEAELADAWHIEVEGEGAAYLSPTGDNQVARAMSRVFAEAGRPELQAHVFCTNRVPTGNGLGSSSTAIVGGALLARDLLMQCGEKALSDADLFRICAEIEGHADNVAPALFGGFTICWPGEPGDADPHFARFEPERGIAAVVVPSTEELATSDSRKLLPTEVTHVDAAYNVAHAGLVAAALVGGRLELLRDAFHDRLHQPYRAAVISDIAEVRTILLDAGCDGVALSGAGPTVIGLVSGDDDDDAYERAVHTAAAAADAVRGLANRRPPLPLAFARTGSRRL